MERRKFEDSFKEAFKDAEANPSEEVWTNIELELEKADSGKVRRMIFFYKTLAAASVIFALAFTGIGYYILDSKTTDLNNRLAAAQEAAAEKSVTSGAEARTNTETTTQQARDTRDNSNRAGASGDKISSGSEAERNSAQVATVTGKLNFPETDKSVGEQNNSGDNNQTRSGSRDQDATNALPEAQESNSMKASDVAFSGPAENEPFSPASVAEGLTPYDPSARKLPELYRYAQKKREIIPQPKPDAVALLMARLAETEEEYANLDKKEKENHAEKLWTSVGFAAGGFNAVNSNTSSVSASSFLSNTSSSVPDKQAKASGVAYSFGVSVGTKIAKRWVLQGGVNYLSQSSDYVATNVVADANLQGLKAESINELDKLPQLADASNNKLAPTVPYSVNNNVQFFSVPVQAGYLIVNKRFGLQLNGGVSTDLFLQNTITPQGGSLDKTTQGRGDDSPYRALNFSGLVGTELSYRFGSRYRISLNPGLRYPLNSVYKSDVGIQSTPLTFDVGLRFRYIFH